MDIEIKFIREMNTMLLQMIQKKYNPNIEDSQLYQSQHIDSNNNNPRTTELIQQELDSVMNINNQLQTKLLFLNHMPSFIHQENYINEHNKEFMDSTPSQKKIKELNGKLYYNNFYAFPCQILIEKTNTLIIKTILDNLYQYYQSEYYTDSSTEWKDENENKIYIVFMILNKK